MSTTTIEKNSLMQTNLPGRVKNTPLARKHFLYPVFEAIHNSIHAIQECSEPQGRIEIRIERDPEQLNLGSDTHTRTIPTIKTITISDNGRGFTDSNFLSFKTLDSDNKLELGGKGIGRILWLKAFNFAQVTSCFQQDGKYYERAFTFKLPEGVQTPALLELEQKDARQGTIIKLVEVNKQYAECFNVRPRTLALKILSHFLSYLLSDQCPDIIVRDDLEDEVISIKELYGQVIRSNVVQEQRTVKGAKLKLAHLFLNLVDFDDHLVYYCAHGRVVEPESLKKYLPSFTKRKISLDVIDSENCVYALYVWGDYLDVNVDSGRTGFSIEEERQSSFEGLPAMADIREVLTERIVNQLRPVIDKLEERKRAKVTNVIKYKHPYLEKFIKSDQTILEKIDADDSEAEIEQKIYKEYLAFGHTIEEQLNDAVSFLENITNPDELEKHKNNFSELFKKINIMNHTNLGKYVLQRKYVIELLKDFLKKNRKNDDYKLEKDIHNLIYPMRTDSETIDYDQHNLWLLDERLSFNSYVASDFSLTKNKAVESVSRLEPDVLIVKEPQKENWNICLAGDDENVHKSIVLIEFKRPMRDDYSKDPIDQLLDYIDAIRDEKFLDNSGRPVKAQEHARFFCYLVCDINKSIKTSAQRKSLLPTPDYDRWYGFIKDYNTYFEIFDYGLLAKDAEIRNNVLFHKLGINGLGVGID